MCIDWFLDTWDEDGVLIDSEYIETDCYLCAGDGSGGGTQTCTGGSGNGNGGGGDTTIQPTSVSKLKVNDVSSSDDGFPDPGESGCDVCGTAAQNFFDATTANSDDTFLGVSAADVDPTSGDEGRTYRWTFLRGVTFHFDSGEYGVRHWNGTKWVWSTFTHDNIYDMAGWVIGGTVKVTSVGAHATIGETNAIMALTYTYTESFLCNNSPFSHGLDLNSACNFDVNATPAY